MHVSRLGSLPELFDAIMETLHVESLLLAMPHGREKMANVWKLRSMAASFAMQEGGGSEDFLDRLNLMRRMQARESGGCLGTGRQKRADHDHPQVQRVGISRCFFTGSTV